MSWIRLYITVEGQTERMFAESVLKPHLSTHKIDVRTRVVLTNRKLGKRGGILDYAKIRNDIGRLMQEDRGPEARFTTMVDLYALPTEFPGHAEANRQSRVANRLTVLESALKDDLNDRRFLPYIQLHEFEALLYCDLTETQKRIAGSEAGINKLQAEVAGLHPEEINDRPTMAPSKRIIRHVPIYEKSKVRVGSAAAAAIGLTTLRAKCPHFSQWVTTLEGLNARTQTEF